MLETGPPQQLLEGGLALLDSLCDHPVGSLRWYRADHPAIVLGRGHGSLPPATATADLPVISRHSGGGAVLLDDSVLSLDVAIPDGHPLLEGEVSAVFGRIGKAWAEALEVLGVQDLHVHDGPSTARRRGTARERLLAAVCYATLGAGEVLHRGRKLVGLAQRRRRCGALVQCGLLWHWRPQPLLTALGADPDDTEVLSAAVGLADVCDPAPTEQEVMDVVSGVLSGYLGDHG